MADLTARTMLREFPLHLLDGSAGTCRLPLGLYEAYLRFGHQDKAHTAWLAPDVCASPSWIWQGLERENQQGSFCYAGFPSGEFANDFGQSYVQSVLRDRLPATDVLLVFIDPQFQMIDWDWSETDPDGSGMPLNYKTRFGGPPHVVRK